MIRVWVFFPAEVTTESGLIGNYWLVKAHDIPAFPTVGLELDYRSYTGQTVRFDRVLYDPRLQVWSAYQDAWLSIGLGELSLWQGAGFEKQEHQDLIPGAQDKKTPA